MLEEKVSDPSQSLAHRVLLSRVLLSVERDHDVHPSGAMHYLLGAQEVRAGMNDPMEMCSKDQGRSNC